MRKIEINIPNDAFNDTKETLGQAFVDAMFYLSFWNMSGFDSVYIHMPFTGDDCELIASYTSISRPNARYVIGAIYNATDKRFSFHS